jgi:hypothetical protein
MTARRRKKQFRSSFPCPHCGAAVPDGAEACPECGSDSATGWSEDAGKWGAGIPAGGDDDDFDYDEFVEREFGRKSKRVLVIPLWLMIIAVCVAVFIAYVVFGKGS